ncbi:MAG: hypothetical protein ACPG51_01195 [Thiolinea sp.]
MLTPEQEEGAAPIFSEQWQAEALAMVDLLIQGGGLNAAEWARLLGVQLRRYQIDAATDTSENYYQAVLAALEVALQQNNLLSEPELQQRKSDWEQAYLSTPHGKPVMLENKTAATS